MKYSAENTSPKFGEKINAVKALFDQFTLCERTVVLMVLLNSFTYENLKLLQVKIECQLAQFTKEQKLEKHILENNSNSAAYLSKLFNCYKSFKYNEPHLTKDLVLYGTDINPQYVENTDNDCKYDKRKVDILKNILTYLPLLKPGNEDSKSIYLSLIPMAVNDALHKIIPTEPVQQIISYFMIHPCITRDERAFLAEISHNFENQLSCEYSSNGLPICYNLPTKSSSTTSVSSTNNSWQAIAPPTTIVQNTKQQDNTSWSTHTIQVTSDCEFNEEGHEFRKTIGKNIEFKTPNTSSQSNLLFENINEDHHLSFSKNGTECLDFVESDDYDKSNTQFSQPSSTGFLKVPNFLDNITMKTRRSNSLTTASSQINSVSSENLSIISQKPRSFSLTMDRPKSSLTSSGSETRLDDFKPNYLKFSTHNVGMSNIGQWLKSLRLHKYIWLFFNITYEQMLDLNEEYLQELGVTKGARHKLVLCIQKLKERYTLLSNMEKGLNFGQLPIRGALDDLTTIILTPMKPVDPYNKEDVAGQFFKNIVLISTLLPMKSIKSQPEKECVSIYLWLLERALHDEAFVAQTNQLREFKFKFSKIKMQFTAKNHYAKNINSNTAGINKPRWNSNSKQHKTNDKVHRKNSGNLQTYNMLNLQQQLGNLQYQDINKVAVTSTTTSSSSTSITKPLYTPSYNKSSSYPNFTTSNVIKPTNNLSQSLQHHQQQQSQHLQQNQQQLLQQPLQQFNQQQQSITQNSPNLTYHRHSLNNIMSSINNISSPNILNNSINTTASSSLSMIKNDSTATDHSTCSINKTNESISNSNNNNNSSSNTTNNNSSTNNNNNLNNNKNMIKTSIGDINSRLEFLCLQMTEQAIN